MSEWTGWVTPDELSQAPFASVWTDGADLDEDTAELFLASARDQCVAFAPAPTGEADQKVPQSFRLAQVMQARPGTQLHGMVPYGDHQDRIEGGVLNATGGAYRTMAGDWYDISFRCAVNADDMTVTSFSFHLGDKKVTRAERKARGLPAD